MIMFGLPYTVYVGSRTEKQRCLHYEMTSTLVSNAAGIEKHWTDEGTRSSLMRATPIAICSPALLSLYSTVLAGIIPSLDTCMACSQLAASE